jgi:hypothetical protein
MTLRELVGYRREQLVWGQLRHERIRDVEQRSQPVPLPDCRLLGEEGLDRDGELAGNALEERDFGRTGIEWRYGAEAERAEPVITGSEGDEHHCADPEGRERVCTNSGQRVSDWTGDTSGCWFSHTQPAGSSSTGSRRLVMTGLQGSFKNMPLHHVAVGIMQAQPDMIEPDNSAKRFGYAREQTSQVSAAGDRTRERDHSLIQCFSAGAIRATGQKGGSHLFDGLDSVTTPSRASLSPAIPLKFSSLQFSDSRFTFSMTSPPFRSPRIGALDHDASLDPRLAANVVISAPSSPGSSVCNRFRRA